MQLGFPKLFRFKLKPMNPEIGQLVPKPCCENLCEPRSHLSSISVFNIEHPISEFAQFPYHFLVLFTHHIPMRVL